MRGWSPSRSPRTGTCAGGRPPSRPTASP
uniref:Uncharacterized protein n=1 Tax=Arundo donax TaxID=35708 RepID=A0A0A9E2R7_ARUDO